IFTDANGKKAIFVLALTEVMQNFVLDFTDPLYAEAGFDRTQVLLVQIEVTKQLAPNRRGQIDFQFGGVQDEIIVIVGKNTDSEEVQNISRLLSNTHYRIFGTYARSEAPAPVQDEEGAVQGVGVRYDISHHSNDTAELTLLDPTGALMSVDSDSLVIWMQGEQLDAAKPGLDGPISILLNLVDEGNEMITVLLKVTNDIRGYKVDLKTLNPRFKTDKVKSVKFLVDRQHESKNRHAKFNVWVKGLIDELKVPDEAAPEE
ncbi:MAG: hypothetical protein PHN49_08640, partial [Candidatus Omnitrophica bacterium]|nr:hypothetical protein [Candidatus Omnitrophota bacterium]